MTRMTEMTPEQAEEVQGEYVDALEEMREAWTVFQEAWEALEAFVKWWDEAPYLTDDAEIAEHVADLRAVLTPSDPAAPLRDAVAALRPTHPIYRDKGLYMSGFAEARTAALAAITQGSRRFGVKRASDCECTYSFSCGACLRKAGPTR